MIAVLTPHSDTILVLKISLDGSLPLIWRRILVPSSYTLGELHDVIQAVMPWEDRHCHDFLVGKTHYGDPDTEATDLRDNESINLREVFKGRRRTVRYTYDYGDAWAHTVRLEQTIAPDPNTEYPICTDGANACPPEDSGGLTDHYARLAILRDPLHADHSAVRAWLPENFDPAHFDVKDANERLRYDPAASDEADSDPDFDLVNAAEVEGLCAWCGCNIPPGAQPCRVDLKLCRRVALDGLEGAYILMPVDADGREIPLRVPDCGEVTAAGARGHTVVATVCGNACAEELRQAWGDGTHAGGDTNSDEVF